MENDKERDQKSSDIRLIDAGTVEEARDFVAAWEQDGSRGTSSWTPDETAELVGALLQLIAPNALASSDIRQPDAPTVEPPPIIDPLLYTTHRCKICGAFWRLFPDSWSLLNAAQRPGPCCDNVTMGDQIEPVTIIVEDTCPTCGDALRGSFPLCSGCQLVEALKAPDQAALAASAAPPPGETQKENDQMSSDVRPSASPIIGAAWRPIETAPKNEDVLVIADDGYLQIGTARFHTYAYKEGGWWHWDWEYESREIKPTHWMPLPAPPDGDRSGVGRTDPMASPAPTEGSPDDAPYLSGSNNIGPPPPVSPVWQFSAEDYDAEADLMEIQVRHPRWISMLRSAAALRREVERLTGEVEIAEQAERHWWEEVRATRALLQAAEREVERLTHEKTDQSSSDPRRIAPPITGTGTDPA